MNDVLEGAGSNGVERRCGRMRDGLRAPVRHVPRDDGDQWEAEERPGKTYRDVTGPPVQRGTSIHQWGAAVNGRVTWKCGDTETG